MNIKMSIKTNPLLRALIYTLGGALLGLGLYYIVGCTDGSCPITSSLPSSVFVMALLGFIMSGSFCGCMGGSCSVQCKTPPKGSGSDDLGKAPGYDDLDKRSDSDDIDR